MPFKVVSELSSFIDFDELVFDKKPVGDGAFGTVYRGQYRYTYSHVALNFEFNTKSFVQFVNCVQKSNTTINNNNNVWLSDL